MKKLMILIALMALMTTMVFADNYDWTDTGYNPGSWGNYIDMDPTGDIIIGHPDLFVRSDDGGINWISNTPTLQYVDSPHMSDDGQVIILGENTLAGDILYSTNGGSSWNNAGLSARFWACTVSGDGLLLICLNEASDTSYVSVNSGSTWNSYSTGGAFPNGVYSMEADYTGSNIFAADSSGYISKSTDGGQTWTQLTSAGSRFWYQVAVSPNGQNVAGVVEGGYVYTSGDSGVTWTEYTSVGAGSPGWYGVDISDDGSKLIVCDDSFVKTSMDGGVTWDIEGGQKGYGCVLNSDGTYAAIETYSTNLLVGTPVQLNSYSDDFTSGCGNWIERYDLPRDCTGGNMMLPGAGNGYWYLNKSIFSITKADLQPMYIQFDYDFSTIGPEFTLCETYDSQDGDGTTCLSISISPIYSEIYVYDYYGTIVPGYTIKDCYGTFGPGLHQVNMVFDGSYLSVAIDDEVCEMNNSTLLDIDATWFTVISSVNESIDNFYIGYEVPPEPVVEQTRKSGGGGSFVIAQQNIQKAEAVKQATQKQYNVVEQFILNFRKFLLNLFGHEVN